MLAHDPERSGGHQRWLTRESFLNIIGISQATPGPIAVNTATYVGFKTSGVIGSAFATFGVILPSVIIVYTIARLFMKYKDGIYVQSVLKFIRLGAIGLIAAAALSLMGDVFGEYPKCTHLHRCVLRQLQAEDGPDSYDCCRGVHRIPHILIRNHERAGSRFYRLLLHFYEADLNVK